MQPWRKNKPPPHRSQTNDLTTLRSWILRCTRAGMEKREGGVMDYSQLSDRDIDAQVLHKIYGNQANDKDIMRAWLRGGFKYTANPADAWPIITKNRISIVWDCSEDASAEWWNAFDQFDDCRVQYQPNPLRAAMVVFLMMQEQGNA